MLAFKALVALALALSAAARPELARRVTCNVPSGGFCISFDGEQITCCATGTCTSIVTLGPLSFGVRLLFFFLINVLQLIVNHQTCS